MTCRHGFILHHFGDEAESLGGCGNCDVCLDRAARGEADPGAGEGGSRRDPARARRGWRGRRARRGSATVAAMLSRESAARRVVTRGSWISSTSTFGLLAGRGRRLRDGRAPASCARTGGVDLTDSGDYPVPRITETGRRVMRAEVGESACEAAGAATSASARGEEGSGPGGAAEPGRRGGGEGHGPGALRGAAEPPGRPRAGEEAAALRDRRPEGRTLVEITLSPSLVPGGSRAEVHEARAGARIAAYGDVGLLAVVREHAPR